MFDTPNQASGERSQTNGGYTFKEPPLVEILCGASLGSGISSLIAKSRSHDQDGRHTHIW